MSSKDTDGARTAQELKERHMKRDIKKHFEKSERLIRNL
jgi:hypothetical protein